MPVLRQNIVTGEWVVIAPLRAKRPEDFIQVTTAKRKYGIACPFCTSGPEYANHNIKEAETKNIYVIPNKFPAYVPEDKVIDDGGGFYYGTRSLGGHEVIVIKDHDKSLYDLTVEEIEELFSVYQGRYKFYDRNPTIAYTMLIQNWGAEAAATIEHPHSQLFASCIIPNRIQMELAGSKYYFNENASCVFCNILEQEKLQQVRIVGENKDFLAFTFYAARFPFEIWIVPKIHAAKFDDINDGIKKSLARILNEVLAKLGKMLKEPPFNWFIHTAPHIGNHSKNYYHWHLELTPRLSKFGGYEMGSGNIIDVVSPEIAAEFLNKRKI